MTKQVSKTNLGQNRPSILNQTIGILSNASGKNSKCKTYKPSQAQSRLSTHRGTKNYQCGGKEQLDKKMQKFQQSNNLKTTTLKRD